MYVGLCFPFRTVAHLVANLPKVWPLASTTYQVFCTSAGNAGRGGIKSLELKV